jgi:hypothetical protein
MRFEGGRELGLVARLRRADTPETEVGRLSSFAALDHAFVVHPPPGRSAGSRGGVVARALNESG